VEVEDEAFEKHAEGKNHKWRAEEEADGTDKDDEPSVEGAMPLAGLAGRFARNGRTSRAGHQKLRPRCGEFGRGDFLFLVPVE